MFYFFIEDGTDDPSSPQVLGSFSLGGLSFNNDCEHQQALRGSSDDEFTSLGSSSVPLSSSYEGPFDGVAVALVDSQPSPYDRHALRHKVCKNYFVKIHCRKFSDNKFKSYSRCFVSK